MVQRTVNTMTKTCVVCKKYPISGDNTRSFHKFPLKEDIKRQWMEATGIAKVTVNCTVCSDHFSTKAYHKTEGFGTVKRLLRNAVPIVNKNKFPGVVKDNKDAIKYNKESNNTQQNRGRLHSEAANENHNTSNTLDTFDDQSCSEESSSHSLDERDDSVDMDDMSSNLNSNLSTTNMRAVNIKRMFRFRDGMKTKYICRDEFVSEEAWDKFLRLMLLNKRRMEGLRQRISRRRRNYDSDEHEQEIKNEVKDDDVCDPEKFLQIILKE